MLDCCAIGKAPSQERSCVDSLVPLPTAWRWTVVALPHSYTLWIHPSRPFRLGLVDVEHNSQVIQAVAPQPSKG